MLALRRIQGLCGVLFEAHCALRIQMRRTPMRSVRQWAWSPPARVFRPQCSLFSSANPSIESSNIQYEIRNVPGDLAEELSDLLLADGALSATIVEHRRAGASEEEIFKEKFGSRYVPLAHPLNLTLNLTVTLIHGPRGEPRGKSCD